MAGNDDFNERIRRIQESKGQTPGGTPPGKPLRPEGRSVASRFPQTILHLGIGVILLGGGAFAFQQTQADASALQAVGLSADEGDQRGFFARMVTDSLLPFPSETPANGDPIMYLPPAPDGWIRVTQIDAEDADPMAEIAERWATLGSTYALDQSPGFVPLTQFLKTFADPGMEGRALAKRRSTAVYLGRDGGFLLVKLSYLGSKQALGEPGDPKAWHAGLEAEEMNDLLPGESLETVDLAGFTALNRAPKPGKSLLARPIGNDLDTPNVLNLAVAVASRAVVRIEGMSPPAMAAALLSTLDTKAVAQAAAD